VNRERDSETPTGGLRKYSSPGRSFHPDTRPHDIHIHIYITFTFTLTFTFRAFVRRFYPKRLTESTFVEGEAAIYHCGT